MKASKRLLSLTPLCALLAAGSVHATNGYFPHGYGLKAKGMGGASVAMTDSAFAGANNPAAAAFAGNRWDLGAEVFMPKRSTDIGMGGPVVESGKTAFLVPEFGYNRSLSDRMGVGVTVYGNGGMNTSYPSNFLAPLLGGAGTAPLGVDLIQLIVAPTLAYKLNDQHSIGVSPLLVYQRFKAYGLEGLGVMNPGNDSSTGLGVRLGYMGKLSDAITVGASYSPKINMSRLDKYAGLFADAGDFDIPANYALGVAIQATPSILVALDYQRINYSGVPSIGNSGQIMLPLGSAGGPGFGWKDVNVVKLGVQWQMNSLWTLRAGYNHGTNPVDSTQVFFNTLAPGVIKSHVTLGATYAMSPTSELSFAYMHAKKNTVSGDIGGPIATIGMSQNSVGVQYSRKF